MKKDDVLMVLVVIGLFLLAPTIAGIIIGTAPGSLWEGLIAAGGAAFFEACIIGGIAWLDHDAEKRNEELRKQGLSNREIQIMHLESRRESLQDRLEMSHYMRGTDIADLREKLSDVNDRLSYLSALSKEE